MPVGATARLIRPGVRGFSAKTFGRFLLAPQTIVARALAGCLPLGHLVFDLGHFVSEPVVGEDMGVGE